LEFGGIGLAQFFNGLGAFGGGLADAIEVVGELLIEGWEVDVFELSQIHDGFYALDFIGHSSWCSLGLRWPYSH
jgi:hypothetical protein